MVADGVVCAGGRSWVPGDDRGREGAVPSEPGDREQEILDLVNDSLRSGSGGGARGD